MPVVMLTSSAEETDIVASYSLGVNSYIVKPVDFVKFVEEVAKAGCYWVLVNRLPGGRRASRSEPMSAAQDPADRGQPRGHRVDGARAEARRDSNSTGAAWRPRPISSARATEFAPTIVLSDFAMPQFDGLSALEIVRRIAAGGSVHLRVGNDRRGNRDPVAAQRRQRLHPQVQPVPAAHGGQARAEGRRRGRPAAGNRGGAAAARSCRRSERQPGPDRQRHRSADADRVRQSRVRARHRVQPRRDARAELPLAAGHRSQSARARQDPPRHRRADRRPGACCATTARTAASSGTCCT